MNKDHIIKRTQELLVEKDKQTKRNFNEFLKIINSMFEDYQKVGTFRLPKKECDKIHLTAPSLEQKPFEAVNQQSDSKPIDIFEGDWELYDKDEFLYGEIQINNKGDFNFGIINVGANLKPSNT